MERQPRLTEVSFLKILLIGIFWGATLRLYYAWCSARMRRGYLKGIPKRKPTGLLDTEPRPLTQMSPESKKAIELQGLTDGAAINTSELPMVQQLHTDCRVAKPEALLGGETAFKDAEWIVNDKFRPEKVTLLEILGLEPTQSTLPSETLKNHREDKGIQSKTTGTNPTNIFPLRQIVHPTSDADANALTRKSLVSFEFLPDQPSTPPTVTSNTGIFIEYYHTKDGSCSLLSRSRFEERDIPGLDVIPKTQRPLGPQKKVLVMAVEAMLIKDIYENGDLMVYPDAATRVSIIINIILQRPRGLSKVPFRGLLVILPEIKTSESVRFIFTAQNPVNPVKSKSKRRKKSPKLKPDKEVHGEGMKGVSRANNQFLPNDFPPAFEGGWIQFFPSNIHVKSPESTKAVSQVFNFQPFSDEKGELLDFAPNSLFLNPRPFPEKVPPMSLEDEQLHSTDGVDDRPILRTGHRQILQNGLLEVPREDDGLPQVVRTEEADSEFTYLTLRASGVKRGRGKHVCLKEAGCRACD